MRMRRKTNLEPRLEKCAHLMAARPESLRGRWLERHILNGVPDGPLFEELHIELGCGKGLFAVETAKREPDVLFVALEKVSNVIVIALERTVQEGLQNLWYINGLVDNLTSFFAESEVARIYINFCDPWPSRRHIKRRLTERRFLEIYRQVLRPDGEIHFKTDDFPLFEFSLNEFKQCGFVLLDTFRNLHKGGPVGVMTDYEMKFYAQGTPVYSCTVRKADQACIEV